MTEKLAIREVLENWVVWRDAGDWERFRTVWTEEGYMMATWFQGSAADFIKVSIEGWNKGVSILHFLGGMSIEVEGNRAIAQTKMTISQRAKVEEHLVDVVCTGRFYDFFEKRDGRWAIVLRQPIYEKDRMDAIDPDPANPLVLDQAILAAVSRRLSPSGLSANQDRLQGQEGYARPQRPGSRSALCAGNEVARG